MGKTTKKMWLAKMSPNWADEADFTYYEIISDSNKKKYEEYLSKYKDVEVMKCFGTNEDSYLTGEEINGSIEWFKIPSNEVCKFIEKAVIGDFGGGEISSLICELAENGGEEFDDDDDCDECECDECDECDDDDKD